MSGCHGPRYLQAMLAAIALLQCTAPATLFQLDVSDRRLDMMVAAPDLDGDGFPDFVLMGWPGSRAYSGRTRAYLGRSAGFLDSWNSAFIGDASGDGVPDIAYAGSTDLRVYRHNSTTAVYSVPLPLPLSFQNLSPTVGPAGDLDQDGRCDVWVRLSASGTSADRVLQLRSCVDGSLLGSLTSPTLGDEFGSSTALLDDLDGDGVAELAIGESGLSSAWPGTAGRVYIMSGVTGALLRTIPAGPTSVAFANAVHVVGDLDGDGLRDVAVLSEEASLQLEVYSAATGGLITTMVEPEPTQITSSSSIYFGVSAVDVGDIDLDLVPDVVVASPRARCGAAEGGAAYVYSGATGELLERSFRQGVSRLYGRRVAPLGDTNGDGRPEWAVIDPEFQLSVDAVRVEGFDYDPGLDVVDWEASANGTIAIGNGQQLDGAGLFQPRFRIEGSGAGVAAFDSSPAGPNAQSNWSRLLVDQGNVLVIQGDPSQSVPGVFDAPAPSVGGGEIVIDLLERGLPRSIDLVALGAGTNARITLRDQRGEGRTFEIPAGFTSDGTAGPDGVVRSLRLDDLADQVGSSATATASEDARFDESRIDYIRIWMDGPGAIDRLIFGPVPPLQQPGLLEVMRIPTPNDAGAGRAVGLGDFDGDGRSELALANLGNIGTGATSSIQVHRGADGTLIHELPQLSATALEATVTATGEPRLLTADQRGSSAVPGPFCGLAYVYDPVAGQRLTRTTGPSAGIGMGADATFVGDVDGDGVEDYVALAAWETPLQRLYVVSGANGDHIRSFDHDVTQTSQFVEITRTGDLDGDGIDDVAATGRTNSSFSYAIRAYSTGTGALLFERAPTTDGVALGWSAGQISDRNGDGVDDLIAVSATGRVDLAVISGVDGSLLDLGINQVQFTSVIPSICYPGDVTGDGVEDVVIARDWSQPGPLWLFSGATLELVETYDLEDTAVRKVVSPAGDVNGDGLADVVVAMDLEHVVLRYVPPAGDLVCFGRPHSGGRGASLEVTGSRRVVDDAFELTLRGLPTTSFALLLNASASIRPFGPGSVPLASDGRLCLDPASLARHPSLFAVSGAASVMSVPLGNLPTAGAPGFVQAAMAGETRLFQAWFRDTSGAMGSNLSDAIAVTFE